ncbi:hypothetical protein Slash_108 [Bacillus phage Slash]|uniref:Uncharacterized protein n=1 Tax=Bacillus phage Slash TaxID=1406790 RepID=U5Q0C7_9CAUD|nr:hypothetical protein Slash_108 [Bacillus phage Slash]AGY48397.1 hypothetical protein Slash_108 [Bacillus phage Slash]
MTRFVKADYSNEQDFKETFKDMSNFEITGIESYIAEWFEEMEGYEVEVSTAYSSSTVPMLNVMNYVEYEGMEVSYFALVNAHTLVMVLEDEKENNHYYYIS